MERYFTQPLVPRSKPYFLEMCHMIVDCCGQNRTYEKFFGLTATRLCMLKREYMELFELIFVEQYETIHRLETNKLRNVAKVCSRVQSPARKNPRS